MVDVQKLKKKLSLQSVSYDIKCPSTYIMNLIHSIITLTFLAVGSAVNPLYSNSSAVTNSSVTTVNSTGITNLATTSSGIANYSSSINSTISIQN